MLIFNMVSNFTFVCNPKKLQIDSLNIPPIHAFTLERSKNDLQIKNITSYLILKS
jgi:hypothetical protein